MSEAPGAVAQAVETAKAAQGPVVPVEAVATQEDPRLAAYERKERQIQAQARQLKQEREAWEQQRKAKDEEYTQQYIPKSRLSDDPMGVLNDAGVTTEKLTELLLNAPNANDPTIRAIKAELARVNERLSKQDEQQATATTQQYEAAKKQITTEVKLLIDGRQDDFEGIKQAGLEDAVVQLIEDTFNTKGYLMDVEDAAKEVENYLIEESYKFSQLKKVQARLKGPTTPVEDNIPKQTQPGQTTLTNSMVQSTPGTKLTEKERRERAMAAFHGKLNQG